MPEIISDKLPSKSKDITGKRFNNLTVIRLLGFTYYTKRRVQHWLCECDCGNHSIVCRTNLESGHTSSCGCLGDANRKICRYKHGGSLKDENGKQEKLWIAFRSAIQRCTDPNHISYARYGGRGIKVLWKDYPEFKLDMLPTWKPGLSLDRKDNDGHYCKDNCKWSTQAEQNRNTMRTIHLTYNGKTQCIADWCKELGLKRSTLEYRYHAGWNIQKILTHRRLGTKSG